LGGFFRLKIENYGLFYTFIDSCKGLIIIALNFEGFVFV